MPQIIRTETRKRGLFGKLMLGLFWTFNAVMLFAMIAGLGGAGAELEGMGSQAERDAASVGVFLGAGMILGVWFFGAALLGMMAIFSRGKTVITETTRE